FASWLDMLQEMNEPVLFLSNDIDNYKQQIEKACSNAVIPKSFNQQIHPSHLFMLAQDDLKKSVHEIVPNYLRSTEAETKWMEKQEQGQNSQQHSDGKQHQDSQQHSDGKQHQYFQQHPNSQQHQRSPQQPNHHKNEDSVHG